MTEKTHAKSVDISDYKNVILSFRPSTAQTELDR